MSLTLKNIYAPTPATTRGKACLIGGDPKGNNFLYTVGNNVVIRNIREPLLADIYSEHSHAATVARYAPSGFYIASGDATGHVRVWDTTQSTHPLKIELPVLGGPILDLAWSPDSQRIIAVGEGREKMGAAFMWDSGASVGEITGHSKPIYSCDFRQARPFRAVTGSEDATTAWFEGPPFKFKKSLKDHQRFVNCVRFNPSGDLWISVGSDKKGFLYDGKDGEKKGELSETNGHAGGIYAVSWSGDGTKLLTASADKTCKVWDAATGAVISTFAFGSDVNDQQVGCLWQGDTLLSISLSGDINYLDLNKPSEPLRIVRGHNKFTTSISYDAANKHLFTGSYDGNITRWDSASGATTGFSGKGHANTLPALEVAGDSLVSCSMDNSVRVTPLASLTYAAEKAELDSPVADVATAKAGQIAAAVTLTTIAVLRNGKVTSQLAVGAKYQPMGVAVSPDGAKVAVAGKDNNVYLYAVGAGDALREDAVLKAHRGSLTRVAYSPDGKWLASADTNREVIVWDTANNTQKTSGWVFHTARVNALAWSPDSSLVASAGLDQNIIVWNVASPTTRIIFKGAHPLGVNDLVWIDDNTLASVGQDCSARTWTVKRE